MGISLPVTLQTLQTIYNKPLLSFTNIPTKSFIKALQVGLNSANNANIGSENLYYFYFHQLSCLHLNTVKTERNWLVVLQLTDRRIAALVQLMKSYFIYGRFSIINKIASIYC